MSLSLSVAGTLLLCILIFLGATFLRSSKAKYPPGIANPAELRRIHTLSSGLIILGETLERLGIGSQVALLRLVVRLRRRRPAEDPELTVKDSEFDGVPVRLYQPRAPSTRHRRGVLFFHGGGFVLGSIESYDSFCRCVAKASGAVLVSVGYRLAPEHTYPAALRDCLTATTHFLRTAERYGVDASSIVLCGDSAGGNLAAGVSQVLVTRTDIPRPRAQALIYPSLQMIDYDLPSFQQNSMVPLLPRERTQFFKLTYLGVDLSLSEDLLSGVHVPPELKRKFSKWLGADNIPDEFRVRGYDPRVISEFNPEIYQRIKHAFDPPCSPLLAEDSVIRLLPKTYILTCEFDVLRDDGILFKKRLEDNGVPVTWYHVRDGFHGIVSFFNHPAFKSGKQAMDNVIAFIKDA
ncbi:arylacetamide deacetylase-like 4 [Lithobates pipiens]